MTDERPAIARLVTAMVTDDYGTVSLLDVVRAWADSGVSQNEAYAMMAEIRQDFVGTPAEDHVLDALDLIEGWVPAHRKVTWQR